MFQPFRFAVLRCGRKRTVAASGDTGASGHIEDATRGHAQLSQEPEGIAGLVVPAPDGYLKRQRIEAALENRTQQESAGLTLKFAGDRKDIPLEEAGRKVLEAVEPPLTQITRRDVARTWPRQHEHLAVVEGWAIRIGSVVSILKSR